jgi:hypothetical protein
MNPITGIAECCARAVSGHAADAPASSEMNSRRLMCSPHVEGCTVPHRARVVCPQQILAGDDRSDHIPILTSGPLLA